MLLNSLMIVMIYCSAWSIKFNDKNAKRSTNPTLFQKYDEFEMESVIQTEPDFSQFIVSKVNFLTFGRMLKAIYNESKININLICTNLMLNEIGPIGMACDKMLLPPINHQLYDDFELSQLCVICMGIVSQFLA